MKQTAESGKPLSAVCCDLGQVLFLLIVDMEQLMGAALELVFQHLVDDRVSLGALDEGRPVGLVQTGGALLLDGDQAVGLARAADTGPG